MQLACRSCRSDTGNTGARGRCSAQRLRGRITCGAWRERDVLVESVPVVDLISLARPAHALRPRPRCALAPPPAPRPHRVPPQKFLRARLRRGSPSEIKLEARAVVVRRAFGAHGAQGAAAISGFL